MILHGGVADLKAEISNLRFHSAAHYLCDLVPGLNLSELVSLVIKQGS